MYVRIMYVRIMCVCKYSFIHLSSALEYSVMEWGEESLTLLTPDVGMEGYLAIPELVRKVFKSRSYVSSDIRTRLGVHILPATSLQILTLRSRGSIEITTGRCSRGWGQQGARLEVGGAGRCGQLEGLARRKVDSEGGWDWKVVSQRASDCPFYFISEVRSGWSRWVWSTRRHG